MKTSIARRAAVPALLALGLAACGSDTDNAATDSAATNAPADTDAPMSTEMGDMDMDMDDDMEGMDHSDMDMNMGDVNATPADDVAGASLARGEYVLLDTRPAGYDDVAGNAVIARHPGGTTVTTILTGLEPNVDYISHVHAQACADDNAGPHYQFEVGGSAMPPNEIHLAFTSDNDGNAFMTAENAQIAGVDARSFVVHPAEFIDNKAACVDFVEDEPGSIDAALAAGLDESAMDDMDVDDEHADHSDHSDEHGDDKDSDEHGDDKDHSDHGDHDSGEITGDLGEVDVPAIHEVDDQLAAGNLDAATQLPIVDAALAALDAVGPNVGNAELMTALTELKAALEAGDLDAAATLAKQAHDVAHGMQDDHG